MRMQENTFNIGWSFEATRQSFGYSRHISANNLERPLALPNLQTALAPSNPDQEICNAAYIKDYYNIDGMEVFEEITYEEYQRYLKKYSEQARAIPSMNLFTVKPDMNGDPLQAKSRIVVLGNLEQRKWSKEDRYAPVLSGSAA